MILRLRLGFNFSLIGIRHRAPPVPQSAQLSCPGHRTHFNSIRARLTNKSRKKPLLAQSPSSTSGSSGCQTKKRNKRGKEREREKQKTNGQQQQKKTVGKNKLVRGRSSRTKSRQQKRFSVAAGSSQRADYMTASSAMHTS